MSHNSTRSTAGNVGSLIRGETGTDVVLLRGDDECHTAVQKGARWPRREKAYALALGFGLHSLCDPFWAHFSYSGFLSSPMK